jgi:hypothetical protein
MEGSVEVPYVRTVTGLLQARKQSAVGRRLRLTTETDDCYTLVPGFTIPSFGTTMIPSRMK